MLVVVIIIGSRPALHNPHVTMLYEFTVFSCDLCIHEVFCTANAVIITAAATVDTKRLHLVQMGPVAAFESLAVPRADGICILSRIEFIN